MIAFEFLQPQITKISEYASYPRTQDLTFYSQTTKQVLGEHNTGKKQTSRQQKEASHRQGHEIQARQASKRNYCNYANEPETHVPMFRRNRPEKGLRLPLCCLWS